MAERYSIADARTSLAAIVNKAEAGSNVELTRRGHVVAVVIALREFKRLGGEPASFAKTYRTFLEKYRPSEFAMDDGFRPARDRDAGRKVIGSPASWTT